MLEPNFKEYSLALIKDNCIIYSSKKKGLRPLVDCINENKSMKKCILHDKIIGLAAARLIIYSKMIYLVITHTISRSAEELLLKKDIKVDSQKKIKNILNKDKTSICPMELKALNIKENELFFSEINNLLYPKN